MVEAYPQPIQWNGFLNPNLGSTVEEGLEMVRGVRSMKSRYELDKSLQPTLLVATKRSELRELSEVIKRLGSVGEVLWTDEDVDGSSLPQGFIHQALPEVDLYTKAALQRPRASRRARASQQLGANGLGRPMLAQPRRPASAGPAWPRKSPCQSTSGVG